MVINFHELYEKYAPDIYRFSFWLSGSAQDAEDITSETFVRALTAADRIRAESVKGYLLTIARNLAYQRGRKDRRGVPLSPDLPAFGAALEEATESHLDLREAWKRLQSLPEMERAALLMHVEQELPYEEIAAVLGISVAAARVKVCRARLKLNENRSDNEGSI